MHRERVCLPIILHSISFAILSFLPDTVTLLHNIPSESLQDNIKYWSTPFERRNAEQLKRKKWGKDPKIVAACQPQLEGWLENPRVIARYRKLELRCC